MSNIVSELIKNFESAVPSLQNQHTRMSLVGILPIQANTNFDKDKNGKETFWAQLLCNFTASYSRTDENGQVHDDNASLKTFVVKFPMTYLKNEDVTTQEFKTYFDKNFVAKKFLFLPVGEEKQSFQYNADKRVPIKNQTEVTIDESFPLKSLITKDIGLDKVK